MLETNKDLSGWAVAPIALAPLLLSLTAFTDLSAVRRPTPGPSPPADAVPELEARAAQLQLQLSSAEAFFDREVRPIERIIRPFHDDERWVRRIAVALVREGRKAAVDPRVLASVALVENPWLDPEITSSQGAVGIMQVMPFHAGAWACESADLTDPDANVCHGARIFRYYLDRERGDIDRALLAYNGCVRGANTSNCHLYPTHIYTRAGRVAVLGWIGGE